MRPHLRRSNRFQSEMTRERANKKMKANDFGSHHFWHILHTDDMSEELVAKHILTMNGANGVKWCKLAPIELHYTCVWISKGFLAPPALFRPFLEQNTTKTLCFPVRDIARPHFLVDMDRAASLPTLRLPTLKSGDARQVFFVSHIVWSR